MKRSFIRLIILFVLFVALLSFSSSKTVHAAGLCLSGRGTAEVSSPFFALNAGDTVTAKIVADSGSDPVEVDIETAIGAFSDELGIGSVTATLTVSSATDALVYFDNFSLSPTIGSSFSWTLSVNGACSAAGNGPLFSDGRLNSGDATQSAAIFCDKGSVVVYYRGNPWQIVLKVTTAEIDRVPSLPAQNTVIKQNAKVGVALYRLTSGELQINAPGDEKGPYSFTFTDCPRNH
jgi:hypothetical protein